MLYPMLPRLSAFRTVTRLSLHSFSVHFFNETDIRAIFSHLFPTVKELNLENPCAVAGSLHKFICHFVVLDHLTISDPEWEPGNEPLDDVEIVPPLRGTLHLQGFYADSGEFLDLLARTPVAFRGIARRLPAATGTDQQTPMPPLAKLEVLFRVYLVQWWV
jgi:hypothetical protein